MTLQYSHEDDFQQGVNFPNTIGKHCQYNIFSSYLHNYYALCSEQNEPIKG